MHLKIAIAFTFVFKPGEEAAKVIQVYTDIGCTKSGFGTRDVSLLGRPVKSFFVRCHTTVIIGANAFSKSVAASCAANKVVLGINYKDQQ